MNEPHASSLVAKNFCLFFKIEGTSELSMAQHNYVQLCISENPKKYFFQCIWNLFKLVKYTECHNMAQTTYCLFKAKYVFFGCLSVLLNELCYNTLPCSDAYPHRFLSFAKFPNVS